jgi:glycosyltransferase involved in cell wall biosynthesis
LRVVLTIHHFPPNYSAGAEVYAFRLAGWLVRHGHEVEVVCIESITHKGGFEHKHEIYEGISVWRLYYNLERAPDPFHQSFDNPTIGEWFTEFLQRVHPDIVHINSCYLLSVSTIAATKRHSLPLIVTLHDFWFVCPRITLLKPTGALCTVPENVAECAWCLATEKRRFRWPEMMSRGAAGAIARRWLVSSPVANLLGIQPDANVIACRRKLLMDALKQADVLLSPSEFLRSIFIEQGVDPAKVLYSRLGLDTSHWITPSVSAEGASEDLRIGYIGQLSPHKGVHLLVEAFNRLRFSGRRARLRIYGGLNAFPAYTRSLRRAARGNPSIEFAGRFDNCRVAEILRETDVVVAPSIWYENSPIAIMEALTTGTPVVTANLGGMPELVQHNVNGLLFEAGNADDLVDQLQRLLDDPGLVAALAGNAHPVRMIDDEMTQIVSLYESILA